MPTMIPASTQLPSSASRVEAVFVESRRRSAEHRFAWAHRLVARLLLAGIALQLFFAGLGVFGVSSFAPHVIWGTIVVVASIALPILAWRGHLGVTVLRRSWLLVGLMVLQGALVDLGRFAPIISALHPVNAMVLALLTYGLATRELSGKSRSRRSVMTPNSVSTFTNVTPETRQSADARLNRRSLHPTPHREAPRGEVSPIDPSVEYAGAVSRRGGASGLVAGAQ